MLVPGSPSAIMLALMNAGYVIDHSIRFNPDFGTKAQRLFLVAGDQQKMTIAFWFKIVDAGTSTIFGTPIVDGASDFALQFSGGYLRLYDESTSTTIVRTSAQFLDATDWHQCTVGIDTTQAVAADRVSIEIDRQPQALGINALALNQILRFNQAALHTIGSAASRAASYFPGYLADFHFIGGSKVDSTNFTEQRAYSVLPANYSQRYDYGVNGFFLPFKSGIIFNTDALITQQVFSTAGAFNYTVPAGATADFLIIGPGGGGGAPTAGSGTMATGGGSGGWRKVERVPGGTVVTGTIGVGGNGGIQLSGAGTVGQTGTNTSITIAGTTYAATSGGGGNGSYSGYELGAPGAPNGTAGGNYSQAGDGGEGANSYYTTLFGTKTGGTNGYPHGPRNGGDGVYGGGGGGASGSTNDGAYGNGGKGGDGVIVVTVTSYPSQDYNVAGTYQIVVPQAAFALDAAGIGAGGGGGGGLTNNWRGWRSNGQGGYAATAATVTGVPVVAGEVLTVIVGAGGTAGGGGAGDSGPNGSPGGTGGDTKIVRANGEVLFISQGGAGGAGGSPGSGYSPQGQNSTLGVGGAAQVAGGVGAGGGGDSTADDPPDYGGPGAPGGRGTLTIQFLGAAAPPMGHDLFEDYSGKNNHFTGKNFYRDGTFKECRMYDTPSKNHPILDYQMTPGGSEQQLVRSNGALDFTAAQTAAQASFSQGTTLAFTGGKQYLEFLVRTAATVSTSKYPKLYLVNPLNYGVLATIPMADPVTGAVTGVAINFTTGQYWLRNNSEAWASGDPVAGTIPSGTFTPLPSGIIVCPVCYGGAAGSLNFGQRDYTWSLPKGYGLADVARRPTATSYTFNLIIDVDTTTFNLRNAAVAAGWNQVTPIEAHVTINAGVYVRGNYSAPAFTTGGSFPAGSKFTLDNNGIIVGAGGMLRYNESHNGGNALNISGIATRLNNSGWIVSGGGGGGWGSGKHDASGDAVHGAAAGTVSGDALTISSATVINNTGTIASGGNGASGTEGGYPSPTAGDGGGGAGEGKGGNMGYGWSSNPIAAQGDATYNLAGNGTYGGASGGALGTGTGKAIIGSSNITWLANGTVLGTVY